MKKSYKIYNSLQEQPEEIDYWMDKSVEERISAMEHLRRQFWPDTIDKPMDKTYWKLVDLHNPDRIIMSSGDKKR